MAARRALFPLGTALVGLVLVAVAISAAGYDVRTALTALWSGATGLRGGPPRSINDYTVNFGFWRGHWSRFALAQSVARATPLVLTGMSVSIALRAGMFNIGAQGQLLVGALAAAVVGARFDAPAWAAIPAVMVVGAFTGALWAAIAGALKAARGVQEVLATIMLNYVASNVASYLILHSLRDPRSTEMAPQTALMTKTSWLAPFVRGSNLTFGFVIACIVAAAIALVVRRTALGFRIRAVGSGYDAARAAGIPVGRTLVAAMAISGALAGLAGAIEVSGVHHRYVQGVESTFGFDGIAVALLGGLSAPGVIASALFFGLLENGANGMQATTGVPNDVALIVQACVVVLAGVRAFGRRAAKNPSRRRDELA